MAGAGAFTVGRSSRCGILGLHNAISGDAHTQRCAGTISLDGGRGGLVLIGSAGRERTAGTIVVHGMMMLTDVLVCSADSQSRALPVARLGRLSRHVLTGRALMERLALPCGRGSPDNRLVLRFQVADRMKCALAVGGGRRRKMLVLGIQAGSKLGAHPVGSDSRGKRLVLVACALKEVLALSVAGAARRQNEELSFCRAC